ncbi:pYEATS domain-containing protein [Thermodesulfobacteriota bacterium]
MVKSIRVALEQPKTLLPIIVTVMVLGSWVVHGAYGAEQTGKSATCRVETNQKVLPTTDPQEVIAKITVKGAPPPEKSERQPLNLCVVLDRSGSMRGEKIQKAREGAIAILQRLSSKDIFSVVIYNQEIETLVAPQKVENIHDIESKIRSISAQGSTAIFGAVNQGANEIRQNFEQQYVHRIILLSDGLANVGPQKPADFGKLGAALIKEGISVTTVGVGLDYNEDLMNELALKSDGNTYFVESASDIPKIFKAELGDAATVVAKNARLEVECPEGVKPVALLGRKGKIKGRSVEVFLGQVYGGQEKYALLRLLVDSGKAGESREIAVAKVSYDNRLTGKPDRITGKVAVKFSDDKDEVEKSVNLAVQTAIEITMAADGEEKATKLADKGRISEAVAQLRKTAERLSQAGKKYGLDELVKRASETSTKADKLDKEGWTASARKDMTTFPQQIQRQQGATQRSLFPSKYRGKSAPSRRRVSPSPASARLPSSAVKIESANVSEYKGNDQWAWTVFVKAKPDVLDKIACVEYSLHPTFPNPVRLVCARGDSSKPFALSTKGWGTFKIDIRVFMKDGGHKDLKHDLNFSAK